MHLVEVHSPSFHLNFEELSLSTNLSQQSLLELIEHNIVVPLTGSEPQHWQFNVACVIQAKKAVRLYRDLEINFSDLALVLRLLDEIECLKSENIQLKNQLDRFLFRV